MPANTYNLERVKRHPLTKRNLRELNIEQSWQSILNHPNLVYVDQNGTAHKPIGFSLNKSSFGDFPGTATELGWLAYLHLGEPLVEERGNVDQPPPDTFSARSYVNRSQSSTLKFSDTVNFTVSNAVTWTLQGQSQLTFGGKASASLQLQLQNQLQLQLQNSMQNKNSNTVTNKNSKDSVGVDNANTGETSATNTTTNATTFTTQGSATGTAELHAQLMLGITASVGGTLTTSWSSTSQISGDVPPNSRVQTIATQRRTRKQYTYEIPVTFSGFLAVRYAVPVAVLSPPQSGGYPGLEHVVARDIGDIDLVGGGDFRLKGRAEVVSALDVHHTMFDGETLDYSPRALYKG
ncbi:hypothetical protein [Saccharothrix australiensis]|uniref:Uncharacterized protein n=1 Tax=Saccharothrix australiensis TaxID=2072 RepID=A0A495VYR5_9PSEU|nr:hypothetical protein [Saccharothrix australiensis]RKT54562.1 hypothetical protein C8E97_3206 [Saccharothrix australiensis]